MHRTNATSSRTNWGFANRTSNENDRKSNKKPENWRRADDEPSKSDRWRNNGQQSGNKRQNGVEKQRSDFGRPNSKYAGNNRNAPFNKGAKQTPDEEFISGLLKNKDISHVENALSKTQRFVKIVNSNLSDNLVVLILKLVARLCDSNNVTNQNYVLKVTMQQKFVKSINSFLSLLVLDDNKNPTFWQEFDGLLNDILTVLINALNLMPMTMWDHVNSISNNISIIIPPLKNYKLVEVSDSTQERLTGLKNDIDKIQVMFTKPENIAKENQVELEKAPETNYRTVEIYPGVTELIIRDRPYVRKNVVDRPFFSNAQYLDIHFRLLREDFVNPIREDICDYMNRANRRLFNIKIYRNVQFVKREIYRHARCFEIQFDLPEWFLERLKRKEPVKRFLNGTLLLFTDDNFNTMISGKVVNADQLKKGRVLIDVPVDEPILNKNYVMIECIVFFEPYFQVLSAFQKLKGDVLPMEKYIVKVSTETCLPKYLENINTDTLGTVAGLNPSQEVALKAAMTREFVIIQGPPGTGKTFLGTKIVEEILKLKEHWKTQGPILVICFTNHALDQFLGGLKHATDKIARLGGKANGMAELEANFGPEATIFNLKKDSNEFKNDTYQKHGKPCQEFIRDIKRGRHRENVDPELIRWIDLKYTLDGRYAGLKRDEEEISSLEKTIKDLKSKKSIIFVGNAFNFNYFYLAFWLLYDDGTIKSKKTTNETQLYTDDYQLIGGLVGACFDLRNGPIRPNSITMVAQEDSKKLKQVKRLRQRDKLEESIHFMYRKADYLRVCLNQKFQPSKIETASVINPFSLTSKQRWELYNEWLDQKIKDQQTELKDDYDEYQEQYRAYSHLREEDNITLLKKMDIVGMTTTCAARMRSTLEALENPIVVVEEAAEVLESHIVTALTPNCQQLVLLGDHKQLRPATADHMIEKKLKLGVSLFERMVNNHVQCFTLNVQHRMRPEFSKLIKPLFYEDLQDHESVKTFPNVVGVNSPLFFIDHEEPEKPYGDSSKMNPHEAKFLIQLAVYLLNNDYKPSEITILAGYLGQAYTLKQERDECCHPLIKDVHITPVDNYQGEENKIILLSLVRSNVDNNIGFLAVDNRVCVALSRAKEGLFIMGNMTLLCSATEIWKPIKTELESQRALGKSLPLCCRNHKEHVTQVSKPSDFSLVPEGGCQFDCGTPLICGHNCQLKCHGYDLNHEKYKCKQPCTKSICGDPQHECKKQCFDSCGSCHYKISKTLPCGHNKIVKCLTPPETVSCKELVQIEPECGHIQNVKCHRVAEFVCTTNTIKLLTCGHEKTISCDTNIEQAICTAEEEVELPCKHKIHKKCYVDINNVQCMVEEELDLPCGHKYLKKCHMKNSEVLCMFEEKIELECGHKSLQPCHLKMQNECNNICGEELLCGHTCKKSCHKLKDPTHEWNLCMEPCTKSYKNCNDPENHPKCQEICEYPCSPCTIKVNVVGENCLHINTIDCWEEKDYKCWNVCYKQLPCGHYCQKQCYEDCGECETKCGKTLPCGHTCSNLCGKPCSTEDCTIGDCRKTRKLHMHLRKKETTSFPGRCMTARGRGGALPRKRY